jgi:hypothetical protein
LANPPLVVAATSLGVTLMLASAVHDPLGIESSASTLRRHIYDRLNRKERMQLPGKLSVHDEERLFYMAMESVNLAATSPMDEYRKMVYRCKVGDVNVTAIAYRCKLTVLSYLLRTALKALPMVVFNGPTGHGKSTLSEYMVAPRGTPPRWKNFGVMSTHRTLMPSIQVAKGENSKYFLILDTVGERTTQGFQETFSMIHKLLNVFVAVEVVVFKASETANYSSPFLSMTSGLAREVIYACKPTLTCYTYADAYSDDFEMPIEDFRKEITRQTTLLGRNLDVRLVKFPIEDCLVPRMWTYLPTKEKYDLFADGLPAAYREDVLLPKDIKRWIICACEHVASQVTSGV